MENCATYPAESLDSGITSNLLEDGAHECPLVDLNCNEKVDTSIVAISKSPSAEDEKSVVTEDEQISQAQTPDTSSCRNRACSVSSDSDSDVSSSTDTTDSSDDSLNIEIRRRNVELRDEIDALKSTNPPKVDGEILISDLPPVEDLCIVLPDHAVMHAFGRISQIMKDSSVVIQSYEGMPALDQDTVLFFSHGKAIGKVEETFGPVPNPYYIVRFNSGEHLISKEVELDKEVFYAPDFHDLTSYVFISTLRKMRGSDASWLNDKEPPPNLVDYSDDEAERREKKALKNKGKNRAKRDRSGDTTCSAAMEPDNDNRNFERQNQWHNESHRVNVLPLPNPAFEGWNAAVSRMAFQRMRPAYPYSTPVFGQPTSMNGMPIPPMRAPHPFHNSPHMNHNYGRGNFMGDGGPRQGWPHYHPQFNSGAGMFPQPPPPPPPPP